MNTLAQHIDRLSTEFGVRLKETDSLTLDTSRLVLTLPSGESLTQAEVFTGRGGLFVRGIDSFFRFHNVLAADVAVSLRS